MEKIEIEEKDSTVAEPTTGTMGTTLKPIETKSNRSAWMKMSVILILIVILGGLSGYAVATFQTDQGATPTVGKEQKEGDSVAVGIQDKKTFKDSATGTLKEGGFEGEGSFHLERPGGESQNVYLTSSAVDLEEFVGKKVTVWGETFAAEKAGWLMDVGLVEMEE